MELTLTTVADDYQPMLDRRFERILDTRFEVSHTSDVVPDSPNWVKLMAEVREKVEADNYYFIEGRKYTAYINQLTYIKDITNHTQLYEIPSGIQKRRRGRR